MKTERERPSAFPAITRRIIALALALWLLAMALLTWAIAKDMYFQLKSQVESSGRIRVNVSKDFRELPGSEDIERLIQIGHPYYYLDQLLPIVLPQLPSSFGSNDWYWGKWEMLYGYQEAQIFYDKTGEILASSGSLLYFPYVTSQMWENRTTDPIGLTYVNLDLLDGGAEIADSCISDLPGFWDHIWDTFLPCLRLTGYFEGTEFNPVKMEKAQPDHYIISGMEFNPAGCCLWDNAGKVTWETVATAEAPADQELVTIYGWDIYGYHYDAGDPVAVNGVQYDTLLDLLDTAYSSENHNIHNYEKESLIEAIIISYSWQSQGDSGYISALAVRCHPLQYAMLRLWPAYLVSLAAVALAVWLILWNIRRGLIRPLEYALQHDEPGPAAQAAWWEPSKLWQEFYQARQDLHKAQNEIQQMRTALDFAKNAEENRRQLVSNLTHDLKTPLAIIHGYTEGLQAGIAGDKQEQYLATILEETERMDTLVLEMLDLSRLEAGKVRLAADQFSLKDLAESIVEKLDLQIQAKGLTVCFDLMKPCSVTADEARIGQVITNLLTNAIKYSPEDGTIWINVYPYLNQAHFTIENTSEPLPKEALEKVWTSFYRADSSRTEQGHGLGLAIVKSIIDLHRGSCSAENTATGVKFRFALPL